MTKTQIIKLIERMNPAEADAMGVSCQYFVEELIKKIEKASK